MTEVSFVNKIITRKCACCKGVIEIDKRNISNVVCFQGKYYHYDCFEDMASEKAASRRGKPQMWQEALDHIWEIEADTKKMLEQFIAKDELNTWLLNNYDIVTVPSYFWQLVSDLEGGMYKRQRCKPVSAATLYECWKWGQKKLNEIDHYNRSHNKGPKDDGARLMYDLAVLVGKVPNYLAYKEKKKAARHEMSRANMFNDDVDMSRIGQTKQVKKKDISDISDDIFVE